MMLEELREEYDWIYEFQSRMAERISGNPDVHNHADYVNRLEAENAELREENQHIGLIAYELGRKSLAQENAELRKLLVDFRDAMWRGGEWTEPFDERMRELGVEV